ncbi:MAG: hypothetical protein JEZ11_04675 [Desulfobacterales bacterium]|nr:hypothetical protein [Desulfobacterales bacterium]
MMPWIRFGLGVMGWIGVVFAGTAWAEHPVKVEEALKFVREKTLIQRECGTEYCFQVVNFSEDACEITAKQMYSKKKFAKPRLVFIGKARLKDLNPKFYQVEDNLISLFATNGEKRVLNSENGTVENSHALYLYTNDAADAERVAKALSFIIELCGGKESYF